MPIIYQSPAHPEQISFGLTDLIGERLSRVRIAVAYATQAGCDRFLGAMRDKLGAHVSSDLPKLLVTSLDFGHTEPEALRYWRDLPNGEVKIANVHRVHGHLSMEAGNTNFHPKVYLFDYPYRVAAFVGSANLTRRALSVNTESAISDPMADRQTISRLWNGTWDSSEILTDLLLGEYRLARRNRAAADLDLAINYAQPMPAGDGRRLIDAIEQGVDPSQYECLWIQAGSMSSGGSRNQLELPRGANRFFGFHYDMYEDEHETIGHPVLISGARTWIDRTLTWHAGGGQNAMERLNLPTVAQGGYQYAGMTILFRRTQQGFEFTVSQWGSDRSNSWVRASAANSALFRTGRTVTSRMCGLLP